MEKYTIVEEIITTRKLYGRGRVQVPSEIRKELGVKNGDRIAFIRSAFGDIFIKRADTRSVQVKKGARYGER